MIAPRDRLPHEPPRDSGTSDWAFERLFSPGRLMITDDGCFGRVLRIIRNPSARAPHLEVEGPDGVARRLQPHDVRFIYPESNTDPVTPA